MSTNLRKEVFTTGEVAKICHVAPRTVSKWFDTGQLRGYRIPGSRDRRIPAPQLIAFMRAHGLPLDGIDRGVIRVLLVDPDAPQELIEQLESDGQTELTVAEGGFEAGVLAEQVLPHAVVLSGGLTRAEAGMICRNIKDAPDLRSCRVIVAAAGLTEQLRWELEREGFDGVIARPVSAEQLAAELERLTQTET